MPYTHTDNFVRMFEKSAGEYDEDAMRRFGKSLRPGDILTWQVPPADAYAEGAKQGLMTDVVSGGIRAATGSPVSHVGLIHSVDPVTGVPNIVHNVSGGVRIEGLDRYAHTNVMNAHRANISDAQAAEAARIAEDAAKRGVEYSKGDLLGMLPAAAAKKMNSGRTARVANRIGEAVLNNVKGPCDPATGVCSGFVAHALEHTQGGSRDAINAALGGVGGGRLGLTPADIYNAANDPNNKFLSNIGEYRPKNQETSRVSGLLSALRKRLKK